eukprot:SAG31_NODE_131_length_23419_cov_38.760087_10_plen_207_part_00
MPRQSRQCAGPAQRAPIASRQVHTGPRAHSAGGTSAGGTSAHLRGFHIANYADGDHWRRLDDGDGLNDFFLVNAGSRLGDFTENVGHAGLVAQERGEVDVVRLAVRREGLHLAAVALASLARQEAERAVARGLELPVGHGWAKRGGGRAGSCCWWSRGPLQVRGRVPPPEPPPRCARRPAARGGGAVCVCVCTHTHTPPLPGRTVR